MIVDKNTQGLPKLTILLRKGTINRRGALPTLGEGHHGIGHYVLWY